MIPLVTISIIIALLYLVYRLFYTSKLVWYYTIWALNSNTYIIDITDHISPPEDSPDYGKIRDADFRTADIAKRLRDTLYCEIMPYVYWDNYFSELFGTIFMRPYSYAYKVYELQKKTLEELGPPTLDNFYLMTGVCTMFPTYLIWYLTQTGMGIYLSALILHFFDIVPIPIIFTRLRCIQMAIKDRKPDWHTFEPPRGFKIPKELQNASPEEFLMAKADEIKEELEKMEKEEQARGETGKK